MSLPLPCRLPRLRALSPFSHPYSDGEKTPVSPAEPPRPQSIYTDKSSCHKDNSLYDDDKTVALWPPGSSTFEHDSNSLMLNGYNGYNDYSGLTPSSPQAPSDMPRIYRLQTNARRFAPHWAMAFSAVFISVFSIYYTYTVLVSEAEVPQSLYLEPCDTVLVVNILSHVVAFLCWNLFSDATEALRWAWACRSEGILLTTFLALSRATPFAGVFYLCLQRGAHQIWAIQRIISFALVTIMGLILITDVTYTNIYNSSTNLGLLQVVSGIAPLNPKLLYLAPKELLSLYIIGYNMGFVTDPKFVVSQPAVTCKDTDCTSIFLPGSLVLLRLADQPAYQNHTIFGGDIPGDYTTIVVENAPGLQLEFLTLTEGYNFTDDDCRVYGLSRLSGLYICLANDGPSMLAGWNACSNIDDCTRNTTWHSIDVAVNVTAFRRFADTAYDSKNASILSVEKIGTPSIAPIDPASFRLYHDLILSQVPQVLNQSDMHFAGEAVSFSARMGLEYLLNTYKAQYGVYTNGKLDLLKGFLCVSFQFNTLLWETVSPESIPADLKTVAKLQRGSYRAIVNDWNVYVFGGLAFTMLFWSIGCLTWVCFWLPSSPNSSAFPEIDIVSKASADGSGNGSGAGSALEVMLLPNGHSVATAIEKLHHQQPPPPLSDLGKLTRALGLGNGMSAAVLAGIQGKKVYCGGYSQDQRGTGNGGEWGDMIVIVTDRDKDGLEVLKKGKYYS